MGNTYDPYFIQYELEVLRSEVILGKVIALLDLNAEWGKKHAGGGKLETPVAIALIRRTLELRPIRNTALCEIRITSGDPVEAAKIANAIVDVYREHRIEQWRQLRLLETDSLREFLGEREVEVKSSQETVDDLRKKLNVTEAEEKATEPEATGESQSIEAARAAELLPYIRAKRKLHELLQSRQLLIKKLTIEQIDHLAQTSSGVVIVDRAVPAQEPVGPNHLVAAGLLLVGAFLGSVGLFLLNRSQDSCPLGLK